MHRDYAGARGIREPEENEYGTGKNSEECENRMNSKKNEKIFFAIFGKRFCLEKHIFHF